MLLIGCQKAAVAPAAATRVTGPVTIKIEGLTCFYLQTNTAGAYANPTLIVVNESGHDFTFGATAGSVDATELNAIFSQTSCTIPSPCVVSRYFRMRVDDDDVPMSADFSLGNAAMSTEFNAKVFHLKTEGNVSFSAFTSDVGTTNKPPKGNVIAVLDLHGATVSGLETYMCQGKFASSTCPVVSSMMRPFSKSVTVTYAATGVPSLKFLVAPNTWLPLRFLTNSPQIRINNNPPVVTNMSHTTSFGKLSVPPVCIPEVMKDPTCAGTGSDVVPGCGNTQWP